MRYTKAFIKYKKEIEDQTDYERGFYTDFWLGWIHCLAELGKITEEEGIELEDVIIKEPIVKDN